MDKGVKEQPKDDLFSKLTRKFGERDGKFLHKVVRGAAYHQSVQDLVAFTGLSFDEVCERVLLKAGDPRHFTGEYKWESPSSPNELNWFYRAGRGYLFGNASRPEWEALAVLPPLGEGARALDFGGGIGQSSLAIAERGFSVHYFDISVVQAEFVRFRAKIHSANIQIVDPYYNGRFNYLDCLPGNYQYVLCQDVLEHIPRYPVVLGVLVQKLQPGGLLVEYSPFNGKPQGKKMPRHSPVHISEAVPLDRVMADLGMEKTDLAPYPSTAWRKGAGT